MEATSKEAPQACVRLELTDNVASGIVVPIAKESLRMSAALNKDEAHKLVDQLPDDATWDDLMHEIYVREAIERGLADSKAGRTKDVKQVRAKYGLPE